MTHRSQSSKNPLSRGAHRAILLAVTMLSTPLQASEGFWFMTSLTGSKPQRSMHLANVDSIRSVYTAEAQNALDSNNPNGNTVGLVKQLSGNEFRAITSVQVFEHDPGDELISVQRDLKINCTNRAFIVEKTEKTFRNTDDFVPVIRKESVRSEQWQNADEPWAVQAVNLACQEKIWRKAMASAAYWLACENTDTQRSKECRAAFLKSIGEQECDPAIMLKLKMACVANMEADRLWSFARAKLFENM